MMTTMTMMMTQMIPTFRMTKMTTTKTNHIKKGTPNRVPFLKKCSTHFSLNNVFLNDYKEIIYTSLKENFGFENSDLIKREIIQSLLDGKDTLAIMPTGGGKYMFSTTSTFIQRHYTVIFH
jgi:superfamily II DNA helicase RecQ